MDTAQRQDNVWNSLCSTQLFYAPEPLSHTTLDCAASVQLASSMPYALSDPILQHLYLSRTSVAELAVDAIVVAANEFLLGGVV